MAGNEEEQGSAPSSAIAPWEPFDLMEALDDEAIMAELKGAAIKTYVYSFDQDGHKVTGLSKSGVDAAVAQMAKQGEVIREMNVDVHWMDDAVVVLVKAGRYLISKDGKEVLLETSFGSKRQTKKMMVYGKDQFGRRKRDEVNFVDDPFFFEKALGKAARNAKRRMIPEALIAAVIEEASKAGSGRTRNINRNGDQEEAAPVTSSRRRRARQAQQTPAAETPPAEETPAEDPAAEGQDQVEATVAEADAPVDMAQEESSEDAPPIQEDITRKELAAEAKAMGFDTGPKVFEALGISKIEELEEKATTNTPYREALQKLRDSVGESAEDTPFDA